MSQESTINMERALLNTLGINAESDIAISELLSPDFAFEAHSLGQNAKNIVSALKTAIYEFNSSIPVSKQQKLNTPHEIASLLRDMYRLCAEEEVWAVYIDRDSRYIAKKLIARGTDCFVNPDKKSIIRAALDVHAAGVIITHNHPSGDPKPSNKDIKFTEILKELFEVFDFRFVDHIIFGKDSFFSYAYTKEFKYKK